VVVQEEVGCLLLAKVFQGVGPEDVTHEPLCRRLPKAVNLQ
jgi:hypothetical protein